MLLLCLQCVDTLTRHVFDKRTGSPQGLYLSRRPAYRKDTFFGFRFFISFSRSYTGSGAPIVEPPLILCRVTISTEIDECLQEHNDTVPLSPSTVPHPSPSYTTATHPLLHMTRLVLQFHAENLVILSSEHVGGYPFFNEAHMHYHHPHPHTDPTTLTTIYSLKNNTYVLRMAGHADDHTDTKREWNVGTLGWPRPCVTDRNLKVGDDTETTLVDETCLYTRKRITNDDVRDDATLHRQPPPPEMDL